MCVRVCVFLFFYLAFICLFTLCWLFICYRIIFISFYLLPVFYSLSRFLRNSWHYSYQDHSQHLVSRDMIELPHTCSFLYNYNKYVSIDEWRCTYCHTVYVLYIYVCVCACDCNFDKNNCTSTVIYAILRLCSHIIHTHTRTHKRHWHSESI